MKIEITPKEATQIRVRYAGKVIFDQTLEAGRLHVIEAEHPKCCGTAEAFLVEGEDEMLIGSADYGTCNCPSGQAK